MIPPTSRKCSKTAIKLVAIVATIVIVITLLVTCSVRASASSYDWTSYPVTPYVHFPISGAIQNDNINYNFSIDQNLRMTGNVPTQRLLNDANGIPNHYRVISPVEGGVTLTFSAFSLPLYGSQYPSSLPEVSVTGVTPSVVLHEINFAFASVSSTGTISIAPYTYQYLIELPEFDIAEAYERFCGDESPVFPPNDTIVVIQSISTQFDAIGEIVIDVSYPETGDILESFPNVEITPPEVDVDAIIEDAYQAGVQAGFDEGWEQGYSALESFNPMRWVINIIQSIFDFKLIPIGEGITVGMVLSVLLVVPFAIWFLRLFAGG